MTVTTGTPPARWYATAEGSHERYWDGETWSAPRRRVVHVVTHPKPEPAAAEIAMPDHVYRDLPQYATVPPLVLATDAFHSAFGGPTGRAATHRTGVRTVWAGTGFAWLAAWWPALATFALLGADVAGVSHLVGPAVLWAALGVWMALTVADTFVVARQLRHASSRPGAGTPRKLSWTWGLVPPVEILARTRVAHSTRLIPFVLYFAIAFPVVWFMPTEWVTAVESTMGGLTSGASTAITTIFDALGIPTG